MKIGGLFGRSAWGPLWEHLEKAKDCISLLNPSIESFIAGDSNKLKELAAEVAKYEKEADTIKENIRMRLSRSIFSSIERSEIMAWLRQQDGIADSCEDLIKLFSLRRTRIVRDLENPLKKLISRIIQMSEDLTTAVKMFGEMDAEEVTKAKADKLNKYINNTQTGKDDVDTLQMNFLEILFRVEEQLDPVSVFFLVDGVDKIARIADRIENVGDIIRHMLTK